MDTPQTREYSANVEIVMVVDGEEISVGRVGPSYAVLREHREIRPGNALIVVTIDGHRQEQEVILYKGVSHGALVVDFF